MWTHCEFPLVFHAGNTIRQCVVESPPLYWKCCLFDRLCCINGYTWPNNKTTQKTCRHRNGCPIWASTARNFVWRNYVGDFRWSSLLCTCCGMLWSLRGGPLLEMGGDRQTSPWCQSNQNLFKCEKYQNTNNPAPDVRPSACQIVYRNYKLARALFPCLAVSILAVFIPRL